MNALARPAHRLSSLRAERDFLLASLEDLEREHAAGDLDADDFEALRAGYLERCAAILRDIERAETGDDGTEHSMHEASATASRSVWRRLRRLCGRRSARRGLVVLGLICVAGMAGLLAARLAGVRLPGQSATGSVSVPPQVVVRDELVQASTLAGEHQFSEAIELYDTVLAQVPAQPEALTYRGWLVRLVGVQARQHSIIAEGDASLAAGVKLAPRYPDAHALYGLALLQDDRATARALTQFRAFVDDAPDRKLVAELGPLMRAAFEKAHQPVPALLRAAAKR